MFDYLGLGESLLEAVEGFDSEYTAEDDAMMEAVESIPCTDDPDDAFIRISMENVENFYAIANAITIDEFTTYVATNEEVVYEEGKIKQVFGTIKQWILKAYAKIKGIFEACVDALNSKIRSDKKFLEKYESKIKAAGSITVKKGYAVSWSDASSTTLIDKLESGFKSQTAIINDIIKTDATTDRAVQDKIFDTETAMKKIRDSVFSGASTEEDFNKKLKETFSPEKTKDLTLNSADIIKEIKEAKMAKAAIKAASDRTKRLFNSYIKDADSVQKVAIAATSRKEAKENKVMSVVGKWNSCCKSCISLTNKIERAQISAINKLHSQARAAAVKMAGGVEQKPANESTSYLEKVELI